MGNFLGVTPTHTEQNDDNDFSIYGNNVIIVNYRQSEDSAASWESNIPSVLNTFAISRRISTSITVRPTPMLFSANHSCEMSEKTVERYIAKQGWFINIYPYTSITIPINENNTWNFEPLSLMELSVYRNLIKNGVLKERSFIDKQEAVRDNIEYKKFFSYLL